jgi:hypothetical protein
VEHRNIDAGREVRLQEEPLMAMTMQRNIVLCKACGNMTLGLFANIEVYPVSDNRNHCFAAVTFETKEPEKDFVETAMLFLRNFNRANATDKIIAV